MIYFDAHCDTILDLERNSRSLAEESTVGHADLPRLRRAGVKLQVFALFVQDKYRPDHDWDRCLEMVARFKYEMNQCKKDAVWITRAGQMEQMDFSDDTLYAILSVEGGSMLGGQLERLGYLYELGVRSLTLTWNRENCIASGAGDTEDHGLTEFGAQVVAEMESLGMAVDLAHIGARGYWNVLERASRPVLFSHGNARALAEHPRNLSDVQIRGLEQNGGLMGICYYPTFVGLTGDTAGVVRHIDYVCQLLGNPEHVCLGSDFDGSANQPMAKGLEDVTCLPAIQEALERLGYTQKDIEKIAWKNLYHFYREILHT